MAGVLSVLGNELVAGTGSGSASGSDRRPWSRTGCTRVATGSPRLPSVIGAIGVMLGCPLADAIVGMVITMAIRAVLRGAATDVFRRLMDAVDLVLIDQAQGVLSATSGVRSVDRVRTRLIGHTLHIEADLAVADSVAASVALREAHDLAHRCELELRAGASPVSRARQRTSSTMRLHTTPTRSFVEPAG